MNIAIILASGRGERMGPIDLPKQFVEIYGKPVFVHTAEKFENHPQIDFIVAVCLPDWMERVYNLAKRFDLKKMKYIVPGGDTRQASSWRGLQSLTGLCSQNDIVLIHDAVRPFVSFRIITDVINATEQYGATDTIVPAYDTIVKSIDDVVIAEIPKRSELYHGQTPQGFRYGIIMAAHQHALARGYINATEDAQLVLEMNQKVYLVEGDRLNIKLTTREDLILAKAILKIGEAFK